MFNVYSIENQNFYLNDSLVSGVQNLSISYNNNINPSLAIDSPSQNYYISAPVVAEMDFDYLLSTNDRFISYTGSNSFSGRLEYGNKYFNFSSGYITNYSLGYTLGQYPKVSIKSLVFGELGNISGLFNYQPKILNNFNIGDNCYVNLNLPESNDNRLEEFSLSIDTTREGVYTIGNFLPDNVIVKYPISVNLQFQFSMSNYDQEKVTNIFTGLTQENLNIGFLNYHDNTNLLNLNFSNLINSQSQLNYSIDNDAKLKINLNTYILSGI
jgi:hypothetical protein